MASARIVSIESRAASASRIRVNDTRIRRSARASHTSLQPKPPPPESGGRSTPALTRAFGGARHYASRVAVLIASNLRKEFSGDPLFESVSFKLERRDRLALVGPNGAGRATLLR